MVGASGGLTPYAIGELDNDSPFKRALQSHLAMTDAKKLADFIRDSKGW